MAARVGIWLLILVSFASATEAGERVRTGSLRLRALIAEGLAGSETLRRLVAAVEATDGVVFVEEGRCRRTVLACLEWRVTLAGDRRFLFVRVDAARSDDDVIASVGHELQHAIEVLENPGIRTAAEILLLYLPLSGGGSRAAETVAALSAGQAVSRELRRSRGRAGK